MPVKSWKPETVALQLFDKMYVEVLKENDEKMIDCKVFDEMIVKETKIESSLDILINDVFEENHKNGLDNESKTPCASLQDGCYDAFTQPRNENMGGKVAFDNRLNNFDGKLLFDPGGYIDLKMLMAILTIWMELSDSNLNILEEGYLIQLVQIIDGSLDMIVAQNFSCCIDFDIQGLILLLYFKKFKKLDDSVPKITTEICHTQIFTVSLWKFEVICLVVNSSNFLNLYKLQVILISNFGKQWMTAWLFESDYLQVVDSYVFCLVASLILRKAREGEQSNCLAIVMDNCNKVKLKQEKEDHANEIVLFWLLLAWRIFFYESHWQMMQRGHYNIKSIRHSQYVEKGNECMQITNCREFHSNLWEILICARIYSSTQVYSLLAYSLGHIWTFITFLVNLVANKIAMLAKFFQLLISFGMLNFQAPRVKTNIYHTIDLLKELGVKEENLMCMPKLGCCISYCFIDTIHGKVVTAFIVIGGVAQHIYALKVIFTWIASLFKFDPWVQGCSNAGGNVMILDFHMKRFMYFFLSIHDVVLEQSKSNKLLHVEAREWLILKGICQEIEETDCC